MEAMTFAKVNGVPHLVVGSSADTLDVWIVSPEKLSQSQAGYEQLHPTWTAKIGSDGSPVTAMGASADNHRVILARSSGQVQVWDIARRELTDATIYTAGSSIFTIGLVGMQAVFITRDGRLTRWDVKSGRELQTVMTTLVDRDRAQPLVAAAMTTDCSRAITAAKAETGAAQRHWWNLEAWDLCKMERMVWMCEREGGAYLALAVSDSGAYALSAFSGGTLTLWDLNQGEMIQQVSTESGKPSVLFREDSWHAISAASSGSACHLRWWSLSSLPKQSAGSGHPGLPPTGFTASHRQRIREERCFVTGECEIAGYCRFYSADARFPISIAAPGLASYWFDMSDAPQSITLTVYSKGTELFVLRRDLRAEMGWEGQLARDVVAGYRDEIWFTNEREKFLKKNLAGYSNKYRIDKHAVQMYGFRASRLVSDGGERIFFMTRDYGECHLWYVNIGAYPKEDTERILQSWRFLTPTFFDAVLRA